MTKGKKAALCLGLSALLVTGALVCDSKYDLECTSYDIGSPRLPESFEGYKILHLSDLHGAHFGRENEKLVELCRSRQPDLIVFTGDMAGKEGELGAVEELLRGLEGLAPMFYVNGNHEWADGCVEPMRQLMERYGSRQLSNEMELIYRGEDSILIVGAEDPNGRADMPKPWELSLEAGLKYSDKFKLWLAHRNDYMEMYPDIGTDLLLCGHAHGGIVRLPGIGGLLSVKHELGAEYEMGLYRGEHFIMEVSRGLGNSIPIPRFLNRPELVEIILHKE